jgi:type IV pilus assembly protein PilQ
MRRNLGEGKLPNILRVVPSQKAEGNRQQASLAIELRERVPYGVRQEGNNVVIDFNVSALAFKTEVPSAANPPSSVPVVPAGAVLAAAKETPSGGNGTRQPISVDFQEADIRAVLRLLSEQSGKNIVVSPEVKGNVTIHMRSVPWEQVLDTILRLNGLVKKEEGRIISVMTAEKVRKIDEERLAAEKRRTEAEEARKAGEAKVLAEKGKTQQIMIEAKIVEANDTFTRTLGVQWGYGSTTTVGSGNYPFGVLAGTNMPTQAGGLQTLSTGVALTPAALAVNFPSTIAPAIGIITGSAYSLLSAQLSALEKTSEGRIVSQPQVLTMDGKKAIIRQGEEVPVVTPATAQTPASTTYKAAELKLEVEPRITPDDRIAMNILASNDRANKAEKDPTTGNMPIYTNKVDSHVVVKNGETVVIGGIMKTEDSKATSGVPWFYKIPILGWLFKQETIEKSKRELLIFVTPRIVREKTVGLAPVKVN